jgi:hypothetical protein
VVVHLVLKEGSKNCLGKEGGKMGLWQIPEKVLLPAEPDFSPSPFEFNGRLANGDQVMAYIGSRTGDTHPVSTPFTRHTAVVFRFDADGVLRTCNFSTTAHGGGYIEQNPERSYEKAREILLGLLGEVRAEGWVSADILVRPFFVMVDDLETGLIYTTDGDDEEEISDYSPELLQLVPFDRIFRRPWTTGKYDT